MSQTCRLTPRPFSDAQLRAQMIYAEMIQGQYSGQESDIGLGFIIASSPCFICGGARVEHETLVGLFGNESCTAFAKGFITEPATSTGLQPTRLKNKNKRDHMRYIAPAGPSCHRGNCTEHAPSANSCTVHQSCLQLFLRNYPAPDDALDRLWLSCVWQRLKWTRAPPDQPNVACYFGRIHATTQLAPDPSRHLQLSEAFRISVERCGLGWLLKLPQEVLDMILRLLVPQAGEPPYYFWRCLTSIELAKQVSAVRPRPLTVAPLTKVLFWERGSDPVVGTEAAAVAPSDLVLPHGRCRDPAEALRTRRLIHLTVDSGGVKRIERLSERPSFQQTRFDHLAFAVEEETFFDGVLARFKNGLVHLELPFNMINLFAVLWDTPTPPLLPEPGSRRNMKHFHTINLHQVTGITFLYQSNSARAIHVHSQAQPCAEPTFDHLRGKYAHHLSSMHIVQPQQPQEDEIWIYVPLSRKDTVLSCGTSIRRPQAHPLIHTMMLATPPPSIAPASFMFRTALSGEIVLGRDSIQHNPAISHPPHPPVFHLSQGSSKALLYFYRFPFPSYVYLTAMHSQKTQISKTTVPAYWPALREFPQPHWHFSWAGLEGVERVRVFYEPETGREGEGKNDGVQQAQVGRDADGYYVRGMVLEYANGGVRAVGQCRVMVDRSKVFEWPRRICVGNWEVPPPAHKGGGLFLKRARVRFEGEGEDGPETLGDGDGAGWTWWEMKGRVKWFFDAKQVKVEIEGGRMVNGRA